MAWLINCRISFWISPLVNVVFLDSHVLRFTSSSARNCKSILKFPSEASFPRIAKPCRAKYCSEVIIFRSADRADLCSSSSLLLSCTWTPGWLLRHFRFSEASLCVFDRSCCLNFSVAFFQFRKPFETNASSAQRASSVSFSREASVQVWQSTPPMLWSKWSHGKSLNHCCWNFNFRFGSIWTGIQLTSWGWKGWSGKLGRVLAHAPFSAIFSFESSTSFWELDCSRRVVGDVLLDAVAKNFLISISSMKREGNYISVE